MAKTLEQSKADLNRLVSMVENRQIYHGAFQIAYEEFGRVYDFVMHFSQRNKQEMQLILFTLYSMQCMEQAIIKSLRGVDVGTRYSSSQFLVILLGAERSDIRVVTERIVQNYFKLYGDRDITLSYDIANLHNHYGGEEKQ